MVLTSPHRFSLVCFQLVSTSGLNGVRCPILAVLPSSRAWWQLTFFARGHCRFLTSLQFDCTCDECHPIQTVATQPKQSQLVAQRVMGASMGMNMPPPRQALLKDVVGQFSGERYLVQTLGIGWFWETPWTSHTFKSSYYRVLHTFRWLCVQIGINGNRSPHYQWKAGAGGSLWIWDQPGMLLSYMPSRRTVPRDFCAKLQDMQYFPVYLTGCSLSFLRRK